MKKRKYFGMLASLVSVFVFTSTVSAQYYYPYSYDNNYYNYGGIVGNVYGNTGYSNNYNGNYYDYNGNYYFNNNGYYNGYNNYYPNVSVTPVYSGASYYNCNTPNCCYGNNCYNYVTLYPTTSAASYVYQNSAIINGSVAYSGNATNYNSATVWFEYGTNANNLQWSTNPAPVYGSTTMNANLQGLTCSTTYYFRAVSRVNGQTQYGSILSFTTSTCGYAYNNGNYNIPYYQPNSYYKTPKKVRTNCTNKWR